MGHWAWRPRSHVAVAKLPSMLTILLSLQVGSRRVGTVGFLEPLLQLLRARALCANSALCPVSSEHDAGARLSVCEEVPDPTLPSCQPGPAPDHTRDLPTHAVPFNPMNAPGMWVGLVWEGEG